MLYDDMRLTTCGSRWFYYFFLIWHVIASIRFYDIYDSVRKFYATHGDIMLITCGFIILRFTFGFYYGM